MFANHSCGLFTCGYDFLKMAVKEGILISAEGAARCVLFVEQTLPGSPAGKVGLKKGDLLISINNRTVNSPEALEESMAQVQAGQKVEVKYMCYKAEDDKYYICTIVTLEAAERS